MIKQLMGQHKVTLMITLSLVNNCIGATISAIYVLAASIAGMLLTTECVITEEKSDDPMPAAMPGGMGGMGGGMPMM